VWSLFKCEFHSSWVNGELSCIRRKSTKRSRTNSSQLIQDVPSIGFYNLHNLHNVLNLFIFLHLWTMQVVDFRDRILPNIHLTELSKGRDGGFIADQAIAGFA
jgi:hypothetical protein